MISGRSKTTTKELLATEADEMMKEKLIKAKGILNEEVAGFAVFIIKHNGKMSGEVHANIEDTQDLIKIMHRYETETLKAIYAL